MRLPVVSGVSVIKALSRAGFIATRQSGSHVILVKRAPEGKMTVVVPKHLLEKKLERRIVRHRKER